jgi:plasmid stability protein
MRKRGYLTVRNVPDDVARELEEEQKRHGVSLNQAVVNTLRKGLGLGQPRKTNGLGQLARRWEQSEFETFERNVNEIGEAIDEDVWR